MEATGQPVDVEAVEANLARLVSSALEAADSAEHLLDCARAAVAVGDPALVDAVVRRVAAEIDETVNGAGAWQAEAFYSSADVWSKTGHLARVLSEAWTVLRSFDPSSCVGPH